MIEEAYRTKNITMKKKEQTEEDTKTETERAGEEDITTEETHQTESGNIKMKKGDPTEPENMKKIGP